MSKIFNGNYTKLDDDVSFQLVRTNPILTTNTKLMYDGENMYFESYNANSLLSNTDYKNVKIKGVSPFNVDIRKFLVGTGDSAYNVFQKASDLSISDTFDEQFETMYWCGAESINSKMYTQELGFIAPLYLRKKLPNYFVIFKVPGPSNFNLKYNNLNQITDNIFEYDSDIFKKAKIVKSFDLREGTVIGNYIRKYTEQKNFEFDKSIFVNFSSKEITYYGIDKYEGVLTSKTENFETELLENDNTVYHSDDWITSGFYRNNLIFPYIINFEFLFDDNDTKDYRFARYFGMYCNDIDLFDFEAKYNDGVVVVDNPESLLKETIVSPIKKDIGLIFSKDEDLDSYVFDKSNPYSFYYIKDKFNNLHQVNNIYENFYTNNGTKIIDIADIKFDLSSVCGFNLDSVSASCERLNRFGKDEFAFTVNEKFRQGESIYFFNNIYKNTEDSDSDIESYNYVTLVASNSIDEDGKELLKPGEFIDNVFSINGTKEDMINALCGAINSLDDDVHFFDAISNGDTIVLRCVYSDNNDGIDFTIECDDSLLINERITLNSNTNGLEGGCSYEGCTFKVKKEDINQFKYGRYLKSSYDNVNNAKVISCVPYINDDNIIDDDYYEVSTDENGKYIDISNTNQVEIVDRFYPKFGILSFFPLKDFDFDTVFSSYGSTTAFEKECKRLDDISDAQIKELEKEIENNPSLAALLDEDSDSDYFNYFEFEEEKEFDVSYYSRKKITSLADGYLKDSNGKYINNEYDYFMENLIPELTTKSKVVPYIVKWGFYDEQKDSCENPYRLNMSKIFGTSNLSSNTFTNMFSKDVHTHSMPYYLTQNIDFCNGDNYQYIFNNTNIYSNLNSDDKTEYDVFVDRCIETFMRTDKNIFDELLYCKTDKNKRFVKKYSRFMFGNDSNNATTLFRGVKFNIIKLLNDNDIYTSEFNEYKFTFLYIPVELSSIYFNNTVYFVKNDTFKYIIGFVVVNTMSGGVNVNSVVSNSYNIKDFCKAYMYGGCYGLLNQPVENNVFNNSTNQQKVTIENMLLDDVFDIYRDENGFIDIEHIGVVGTSIKQILKNLDNIDSIDSILIHDKSNSIKFKFSNIETEDENKLYISPYFEDTKINIGNGLMFVDITFNNIKNENGEYVMFKDFYNVFEQLSTYHIKNNINDDAILNSNSNNVRYYSTTNDKYRIEIEDPISFNTYDILTSIPTIVPGSGVGYPSCSSIGLKNDVNDLNVKTINRYSGYYNPICNDILMFDDYKNSMVENKSKLFKFSNTKFDVDYSDIYGKFGVIKNVWFHKVNEDYPNNIITMTSPFYPVLNQFALDYRDYNIFESNWDKDYFTVQTGLNSNMKYPGTGGMLNKISMFGSKYMNVPETVTIDTFNNCEDWNDDFITDPTLIESDIMYKEINGNVVNFYLFLYKRIVRYFAEETNLRDEFVQYINPTYSYGNKITIEDDIKAYVEKNIMKLYELESIRIWVKRNKVGIYDKDIDNDYVTYLSYNNTNKIKNGLQKINTFNIQNTGNLFDRKIVYNLRNGYEEKFGFSITLKKI